MRIRKDPRHWGKLSIGAKQYTNKNRARQTARKTDKQIAIRLTNKQTEKGQLGKRKKVITPQ